MTEWIDNDVHAKTLLSFFLLNITDCNTDPIQDMGY